MAIKNISIEVREIVDVSGRTVLSIPRERALKNMLAKMIGELYYPQYQASTYEEADIPTRQTVDQYLQKIIKTVLNQ